MATKRDRTNFSLNQTYNSSHPYYYFQGDNIIGRLPYDTAGTARIIYYKISPVLVSDADELPVSMHGYTKSFTDWGVAQALYKDGKDGRASIREKAAYTEREKFTMEITPRSETGVVGVTLDAPIDGEDEMYI